MPDPAKLDSDLDAIRALAEVLDETGLTEVEIERKDVRLRVSKAASATTMVAAPAAVSAAAPSAGAADAAPASGTQDLSKHPGAVTAPMVGTAYMAASPGAAPFVAEGQSVVVGQTLMIVEAMKTMNEIKAHTAGKVTQILAADAEPVEFGEPLMIIE